jgi:hypothetical protein
MRISVDSTYCREGEYAAPSILKETFIAWKSASGNRMALEVSAKMNQNALDCGQPSGSRAIRNLHVRLLLVSCFLASFSHPFTDGRHKDARADLALDSDNYAEFSSQNCYRVNNRTHIFSKNLGAILKF